MIQNEDETDRLVRAVIGVILILAGLNMEIVLWRIALFVLGGVLIFTSFTGFCLIYKIIGISTTKK